MCGYPSCQEPHVVACAYTERMRRPCPTSWCTAHGHHVEGRWFCPRHGAIVAALHASGDLSAEPMSDITSVAATLLLSVSAGADEGVRFVLEQVSWRWPANSVLREPLFLRHVRERRERMWESSWKLIDSTGALASVVLVVQEHDPTSLLLRVDHRDAAIIDIGPAVAAVSAMPPGEPAPLPPAELVEAIVDCAATALDIEAQRPANRELRELMGLPAPRPAPARELTARPTAWQRSPIR